MTPRLRFLPIVIVAISALLLLKVLGLVMGTRLTAGVVTAQAQEGGEKPAAPPPPPPSNLGKNIIAPAAKTFEQIQAQNAEQELLQSLAKRRDELEKRASSLDLREKLLQAAQDKLDQKLAEMRQVETNISDAQKKQLAEEGKPGEQLTKMVAMYEQMKPKEAASIFEKLSPDTALALIKAMNPRKVSPILAAMSPDLAGKLTAMMTKPATDPTAVFPTAEANPLGTAPPPVDPATLPKVGAQGLAK